MIKSKYDLEQYIEADLKARFGEKWKETISVGKRIRAIFIPYPWYFQILLRKAEYYTNCGGKISKKIIGNFMKFRAYRYGAKCGFSIPLNAFGPGLFLAHVGTIVVNGGTKFGANIRIQACVNIGSFSKFDENWTEKSAPVFGNNIYIGPGAKIWGPISIGDNVAIGVNAVISKSVPDHCTVIGANKILNNDGSIDMLRYGDEQVMPHESYAYKMNH